MHDVTPPLPIYPTAVPGNRKGSEAGGGRRVPSPVPPPALSFISAIWGSGITQPTKKEVKLCICCILAHHGRQRLKTKFTDQKKGGQTQLLTRDLITL